MCVGWTPPLLVLVAWRRALLRSATNPLVDTENLGQMASALSRFSALQVPPGRRARQGGLSHSASGARRGTGVPPTTRDRRGCRSACGSRELALPAPGRRALRVGPHSGCRPPPLPQPVPPGTVCGRLRPERPRPPPLTSRAWRWRSSAAAPSNAAHAPLRSRLGLGQSCGLRRASPRLRPRPARAGLAWPRRLPT